MHHAAVALAAVDDRIEIEIAIQITRSVFAIFDNATVDVGSEVLSTAVPDAGEALNPSAGQTSSTLAAKPDLPRKHQD